MLLDSALIRGPDDGRFVFFREVRRQLNVKQNFVHHAVERVGLQRLDDLDPVGGDTALLAEAEDIDAGTGANGR